MRNSIRFAGWILVVILSITACGWSQSLYATSEAYKQLLEVNMTTKTVTVIDTNLLGKPDSLIVDSSGRILYTIQNTATVGGTVSIFDPVAGTNTIIVSGLSQPRDLIFDTFSADQPSILVSNFGKGEIDHVNLTTGLLTPIAKKLGTVDGIAYDASGQFFAVINHHSQVAQIDPVHGTILKTITIPKSINVGSYGLDGLTYDSFTGQLWAADVGVPSNGIGNCLVEIPTDLSGYTAYQVGNLVTPDGLVSDGNGNLYIGVNLFDVAAYNIPSNTITETLRVKSVDDVALVP